MSEENQNTTPTNSFELPKASAPTVRFGEQEAPKAVPAFSNPRPADFNVVQKSTEESPVMVAVDALCAVVAVSFAVLTFLEM